MAIRDMKTEVAMVPPRPQAPTQVAVLVNAKALVLTRPATDEWWEQHELAQVLEEFTKALPEVRVAILPPGWSVTAISTEADRGQVPNEH